MHRRRIVFLTPIAELGGAERSLLDLLCGLQSSAPHVEAQLVSFAAGPLVAEAQSMGIRADVLPMSLSLSRLGEASFAAPQAICSIPDLLHLRHRLRKILIERRAQMIHSNGVKTHVLAALARPGGVPLVWHVRDFLQEKPTIAPVLRSLARSRVGVIAVSASVAKDVQKTLRRRQVVIEPVHDGIDLDQFAPGSGDAQRLDLLAGFKEPVESVLRVGLVATYARWKGQELFLKAIRHAIDFEPKPAARFYIVGGPIYKTDGSQFSESELRALAGRHGIAEHVGFVPFQVDIAWVYRTLDIVVHASTRPEPFGRTIAEAMACGRAVIAANSGGAAELFNDGVDALGFETGNPVDLCRAIIGLARDPRRRHALGIAARATAAARFSRNDYAGQVLCAYEKLNFLTGHHHP